MIDLLPFLQLVTVMLGVVTVCLSLFLAYLFFRLHRDLGFALGLMLLAEAFVGFCTLIFSTASLVNIYNTMTPEAAMAIRWAMFLASSVTSIHLYIVLRRLR